MRRNNGLIQICTGMAMANTTQSRACLAEPQNAESARVEDTELSVISPHPGAETRFDQPRTRRSCSYV